MSLIHKTHKSFTLVEMVIVVSIILIILGFVLPSATSMWRRNQVLNVDQRVMNILQNARSRSMELKYSSYGVLFHVDSGEDRWSRITYIKTKTVPDFTLGETWQDVCDRYEVDLGNKYANVFLEAVGFAPLGIIGWDMPDILNEDYRAGKQRNFFAIVFRRGERELSSPIIIHDEDADDDGFGDHLRLPVGDVVGKFDGQLNDVLTNDDNEVLELELEWNVVIYEKEIFKLLSPAQGFDIPYRSVYLTRLDVIKGRESP